MDNLGDWLYIVFLAIAVISGLFSSGNKKKNKPAAKPVQPEQQANTTRNTTQGKGFWEILEEMQKNPGEENTQRGKQTPPTKESRRKTAAPPTPFLTAERSIPDLQTTQQSPILFEDIHNAPHSISGDDFHLQDVEEVRKAIIYSEILNRKYQ